MLAPAFVEPEAERLVERIIVARHRPEHDAPDDVEVRDLFDLALADGSGVSVHDL